MWQDGLVLVFSLQPWQEHCRASACTRTRWEPLPSTGNTELMLLERQQLPRIPGAFVERFFSSTAKSLPICKEQTQSKGSCEAGFPLYQILAKKAFPAPRCCDDSIRGWNEIMHLPSYLLSFPVPVPCPGSHGRGSWCSSWSSDESMWNSIWNSKSLVKNLPFFLFPWHSCLTLPLLHLPVHRVLSKGFMKLQEGLSMIHKCAELGHVWPVQLLGNESMGAVFVKADPSPPIPHGKQGQQQKIYRIKVLGKALSVLVLQPLCVSCPLLFLQPEVHKSLRGLAGVSLLSWKWRTVILPLTLNDLILCKTELLAKPLSPPSPPIAFHPHEILRSELYSVVCVPRLELYFYSIPWVVLHGGGLKFIFL